MQPISVLEPSGLIPKGMRISDIMEVFGPTAAEPSVEMTWRWLLFEIAADTVPIIYSDANDRFNETWKEEARLRASSLLKLAMTDRWRTPTSRGAAQLTFSKNHVLRLSRIYRGLQRRHSNAQKECAAIMQAMTYGLLAAYRPVVPQIDFRVSLESISLGSDQRRALILFSSCILQGLLERASERRCGAVAQLTLKALDLSTVRLRLSASDRLSTIYASPYYDVASMLAAALKADFSCREREASESIIELHFSPGNMSGCGIDSKGRETLKELYNTS